MELRLNDGYECSVSGYTGSHVCVPNVGMPYDFGKARFELSLLNLVLGTHPDVRIAAANGPLPTPLVAMQEAE